MCASSVSKADDVDDDDNAPSTKCPASEPQLSRTQSRRFHSSTFHSGRASEPFKTGPENIAVPGV
ncbi:hypothetical protein GQ607_009529 [Colletotrichum asianum]|uniref:Uncharacterized protein n=1 Tax=Colletotrichum asianum TaxID=702518 RepID=A0A8H3WB91_9PEZI|nr:hypothetical protein GQ607_009529 [Colletotrichum asianum]